MRKKESKMSVKLTEWLEEFIVLLEETEVDEKFSEKYEETLANLKEILQDRYDSE